MKDLRDERLEAANRLRWMVPECGAYPLGEIGSAIMGGSFTVSELRDRLIWLLSGDMGEDGKTPVEDANGTAGAAAASESGLSWLDSAALAECRRLTAENAALTERNAELRAALDEQGDELARVRREAASVPTELDGGRLLIVADSIASDGEGLRTIEAYGRFFEREDGRAKSRTIEDVLLEFAQGVQGQNADFADLAAKKYADEIRELTEVD